MSPVDCGGNEQMELDGVSIQSQGIAVDAHGRCTILITNSRIVGDVGMDVHGAAEVTVRGTRVEGRNLAVELHGRAKLIASDSHFVGALDQHGIADLVDDGSNTWE